MFNKILIYLLKLLFLGFSWFSMTFPNDGQFDENWLWLSVFIYSGGVAFDSFFYMLEAQNKNTFLGKFITVLTATTLLGNLAIVIFCVFFTNFTSLYLNSAGQYNICLQNKLGDASVIFDSQAIQIPLKNLMLFVGIVSAISSFSAILLEIENKIAMRDGKNSNKKTQKESV